MQLTSAARLRAASRHVCAVRASASLLSWSALAATRLSAPVAPSDSNVDATSITSACNGFALQLCKHALQQHPTTNTHLHLPIVSRKWSADASKTARTAGKTSADEETASRNARSHNRATPVS
ncbi:unnamed protein product [Cercospora beticola]|nr:unnamed protein product [Cercospora beticola]